MPRVPALLAAVLACTLTLGAPVASAAPVPAQRPVAPLPAPLSAEDYLAAVAPILDAFAASIDRFFLLDEDPRPEDGDWKLLVVQEITAWAGMRDAVAALDPPAELRETHRLLVRALDLFAWAGFLYLDGIDEFDDETMRTAVATMAEGVATLDAAGRELRRAGDGGGSSEPPSAERPPADVGEPGVDSTRGDGNGDAPSGGGGTSGATDEDGDGCADQYVNVCLRADVTCTDLEVRGVVNVQLRDPSEDPYRLDQDGDGVGCDA